MMLVRTFSLLAFLVVSIPVDAIAQPTQELRIPAGVVLGRGFDIFGANPKGVCVETANIVTATGRPGGGVSNYHFDEADTLEEIRRTMSLSTNASFGFGIFGGDARSDYVRSTEFSSHRNTLYLSVQVVNSEEQLSRFRLTADASRAARQGIAQFRSLCGDAFASGRNTGGTFLAVVSVHTANATEQQQLSAEIKVGIGAIFSGKATYQSTLQATTKNRQVSGFIFRGGRQEALPDMNQLSKYAEAFPATVSTNGGTPVPVSTTLSSYTIVEGLPNRIRDYYLGLENRYRFLELLAAQRERATTLRNDLL